MNTNSGNRSSIPENNQEYGNLYNSEADQFGKSNNINRGFEGDENNLSDALQELNKTAWNKSKKRKRISLSCLNCKRRKVKCDRKRPICTSCIRNRIPAHLCVYKESPHILNINQSVTRESTVRIRQSNQEKYDLTEFVLFKYKGDVLVYLGPTCWKTILFQAFKDFDFLKEISKKTHEDVGKYLEPARASNFILNFSITEAINDIPALLPSYKVIVDALTMFLQMPNVEVSNCVSYESLFNYLQTVIIPNQCKHKKITIIKNCSLPKLSIILYIYAIASWNNSDVQLKLLPILQTANQILLSNSLQTNTPTLIALTLMHYCNKNKYNIELKYSYHDQSIFPPMISIALFLGLNRYHSFPGSEISISEFKALKGIWKYLVLEDTKRSFQRGCQPLIQDICWSTNFLEEEGEEESTYNERIKLLTKIAKDLSLQSLSKQVSLDVLILELDYLIKKRDLVVDSNFGGHFQQSTLISLTFLQCLSNIRYLKDPTRDHKISCFKYSLTLYIFAKEIFSSTLERFNTLDENEFGKQYSTIGYIHDLEEAICRCGLYFMSLALTSIVQENFARDYMKVDEIGFEVSYDNLEKLFATDDSNIISVVNNVNWLTSFINTQFQPLLSKFGKHNLSAEAAYIFIGHTMKYIERELNKISETPNLLSSQYSLDETNMDIMSIFEPAGITKEEFLELLMI